MSYILDALKKSNKEREKGITPSLHTVHGTPPHLGSTNKKRKSSYKIALLFTILLVTTGGVSFWKYPAIVHFFKIQQATPSGKDLTPNNEKLTNTTETKIAIEEEVTVIEPQPIPTEKPPISTGAVKQLHPLLFEDVPEHIQLSIPDLKLAGHTYSETPRLRMILVNNKILREGDYLEQNLKLQEITWDGVIFNFQGTEFVIPIH